MEFTEQSKVVEWSPTQMAFHVEPLGRTLERNQTAFCQGNVTDYIPIAVCNNDAELDAFMAEARKVRDRLEDDSDPWGHIPDVMKKTIAVKKS